MEMALYELGICYKYGFGVEIDEIKAFFYFKESALKDYAKAQFNVGYCYANGIGTKQDIDRAMYWYKKAADQGHKRAQRRLELLESVQGN